MRPWSRIAGIGAVFTKFVEDRGTHLAAMIAYFAIVSLVPLLFLALSLVAFAGRDESSFLIEELRRALPSTSVDVIVDVIGGIQERAPTLSIVGAVGLLWGALGLFSVLESAFNIVYGLPNRPFLRQKLLVLVLLAGGLIVLFLALVAGSYGVDLTRNANIADRSFSYVYAVAFSTLLLLVFVWSTYRLLTNARPALSWRETLPGAAVATIFMQASFQALPFFLRGTSELYALQAFGGLVLLLVWLYLMSNIIVFGAEVNWWLKHGRVDVGADSEQADEVAEPERELTRPARAA